jgi:serine protease
MRIIFTLLLLLLVISSCNEIAKKPDTVKAPPRKGPHRQIRPPESVDCEKKPIVVAIIDTGFGYESMHATANLCKFGHKDFTNGTTTNEFGTKVEVPKDIHGHGTHIAGIIDALGKASGVNYCLIILKYYSNNVKDDSLTATIKAINYAKYIRADYINYSSSGDEYSKKEEKAVKEYIAQGGKFIAAAGNENKDIDKFPFYPARYEGVISVGALSLDGDKQPLSNYGKSVTKMERGENVASYGFYMSGTSQAAAMVTGKMLANEKDTCYENKH